MKRYVKNPHSDLKLVLKNHPKINYVEVDEHIQLKHVQFAFRVMNKMIKFTKRANIVFHIVKSAK